MEIKKDLTPINYTPKGMKDIRGIVIHSMWGFHAGSIKWFKNKEAKASAHYCISKDGEIVQTVLDIDMAWHAGKYDDGQAPDWALPNPNFYCLGIEFEDEKNKNWPYPDAQRQAGRELVKYLRTKYDIPKENVLLHKDLNPSRRSDPVGAFSFDWLFGIDETLEKCHERVGYLERTLSDVQRNYKAEKTAKETLDNSYKELNRQHQGTLETINHWNKFLDDLWEMLNPLTKISIDKTTQAVLGEVKTLIEQEDQLQKELENVKGWHTRYTNLFDKVSSVVQYTGDDEKTLLRRLHEVVGSSNLPEEPEIIPNQPQKSWWQRLFDIILGRG